MKISAKFAELLGAFIGDGWISKGKSSKMLVISGNPKDEKPYYERIKFLFDSVFGLSVKPRDFPYWKTYGVMVTKTNVIEDFLNFGIPVGFKGINIDIPEQIKIKHNLSIAFLRGLFDTDGTIYFQKSYGKNSSKWQSTCRHIPTIEFCSISPNLINSIAKILLDCDFNFRFLKPRKSKRGKHTEYKIILAGKEKCKRFFEVIKPQSKKHLDKFNLWLKQGFY